MSSTQAAAALLLFLRLSLAVETYDDFESNAKGLDCIFPFVYDDKEYYNCTTIDNEGVEWCFVTNGTNGKHRRYGNCIRPVGCEISVQYNSTAIARSLAQSVSTETELDCKDKCESNSDCKGSLWNGFTCFIYTKVPKTKSDTCCTYYSKTCLVTTWGGNGKNNACTFPFIYRDKLYNQCIKLNSRLNKFWCPTTLDYDGDKLWGYCQIPESAIESESQATDECPYTVRRNYGTVGATPDESVTSLGECMVACNQKPDCVSFDFHTDPLGITSGKCSLVTDPAAQLYRVFGWINHYIRENGTGSKK